MVHVLEQVDDQTDDDIVIQSSNSIEVLIQSPFDNLDRRTGNGSKNIMEDWLDEHSTIAENQWSSAATTFYVEQAPHFKKKQYESLYDIHHGWGETDRSVSIRHSEFINDAETFATILELPSYQREQVVNICTNMHNDSLRFGGRSYEKIILAVCSLISDRELGRQLNRHTISDHETFESRRLHNSDIFQELMDVNGLTSRELSRIRQTLRSRTDYF